jgi:aldehyde:ferredoxin oxidoreductase
MPPGGYFGNALLVDLSTASGESAEIEDDVLRSYIGGAGLGTWLMHQYCPVGIDPLHPDAPLIFVFSPLVGTPLTTSAKFAVVAKSPLTGRLTDALASAAPPTNPLSCSSTAATCGSSRRTTSGGCRPRRRRRV